jgi:large subunit ribosomal protein L9
MKVLLLDDVYNLGRAGDVKKVANGYGRNYLIPQGLAVLATPGALKEVEHIRTRAVARRAARNEEMSVVAEQLSDVVLTFAVKAGETGKLYGSVTTQMLADSFKENAGVEIDRRQIDSQPIRTIGEHKVAIRLTMDLIPEVTVIVHREGESPESIYEVTEELTPEEVEVDAEAPDAIDEGVSEAVAEVEVEEENVIESGADTAEELNSEKPDAEAEMPELVEEDGSETVAEAEVDTEAEEETAVDPGVDSNDEE